MTDELEITYMSFIRCIVELDTKKSRGGKSGRGNGC